ncbi:NAD(P)-binding protein [Gonapodya prolifera JEL478]|uniref:NAD(P)-binding protein n=1 Tax=Gonapodya prolifera (strain JEL478) TaxID=1344416 RepID=A0A139ABL7_GONPJ|nr:NAD(P)-binding protein [Gonapodya prolifera JEL478]|eukprot:KXS14137.1 NAD(P)-binding protein [Gonapodya prolifera JEL478]
MTLKEKICLVTGGTEGIGLAVTQRLLELGAKVMIGNRNEKRGEDAIASLKSSDPSFEAHIGFKRTDISSMDDNRALVDATTEKFGGLDVVVANAGFSCSPFLAEIEKGSCVVGNVTLRGALTLDPTHFVSDEGFIHGIQGNLVGTMVLCRAALTYWSKASQPGSIVITSSVAGYYPSKGHPCLSYAVCKAAQSMSIVVFYISRIHLLTNNLKRCTDQFGE